MSIEVYFMDFKLAGRSPEELMLSVVGVGLGICVSVCIRVSFHKQIHH